MLIVKRIFALEQENKGFGLVFKNSLDILNTSTISQVLIIASFYLIYLIPQYKSCIKFTGFCMILQKDNIVKQTAFDILTDHASKKQLADRELIRINENVDC